MWHIRSASTAHRPIPVIPAQSRAPSTDLDRRLCGGSRDGLLVGMKLFTRIAQWAKRIKSGANDLGMSTAEYAVGTVTPVGPCAS